MSQRMQSGPRLAGSSIGLAAVFGIVLSLVATVASAGVLQGRSHWDGQYTYSDGRPPVPFSWSLFIQKTGLDGNSEEPATFGNLHAKKLTATLVGTILGNHASITKTYDGMADVSFEAKYSADFSADGQTLSGTWSAPEVNAKGAFEAHLVRAGE